MEDLINFTRESLGLSQSVSLRLSPLEVRGSDRAFFRLKWNSKESAILVHYDPKRVENRYYADIAEFLCGLNVPVPRVIRHNSADCLILMQDLGDMDLWSLREAPWETRRILYQKALTIVNRFHSFPEKDFPLERVRLMEGFGLDLYRWEQNYFKDHCVRDVCRIQLESSFEQKLEAELSYLGKRLSERKRCLIHRDLQSHNIMIRDGEPFLIDFQGMRFGNLFYDLASLLCDPYVNLSESERDELLSFYYGLTQWDLDWTTFQTIFWEASTQRLMQALGAYGFLGLGKKLHAYLEYIPSGLRNLHLAANHAASLPQLHHLSRECQRAIEQIEGSPAGTHRPPGMDRGERP